MATSYIEQRMIPRIDRVVFDYRNSFTKAQALDRIVKSDVELQRYLTTVYQADPVWNGNLEILKNVEALLGRRLQRTFRHKDYNVSLRYFEHCPWAFGEAKWKQLGLITAPELQLTINWYGKFKGGVEAKYEALVSMYDQLERHKYGAIGEFLSIPDPF